MSNDSKRTVLSPEDTGLDRRKFLAIAGTIGAPVVAGCVGEGDDDDDDIGAGDTLYTSLEASVDNLDPAYTSLAVTFAVTSQIVESLFRFDHELGIVEELGTDIELSDDGTTWTVELREGVEFQPPHQREFVADDVVTNFERRLDPDAGTVWETEVAAIDSVEAIDDYTVEFSMDDVFTTQDEIFGRGNGSFMVSPEALEEGDGEVRSEPVGTGPFTLENWVTGSEIRLSKFEDYWQDDKPFVEEVVFRKFDEPSVKITELLNGDLHIVRNLDGDFVDDLDGEDEVDIQSAPSQNVRMIMFNTTDADTDFRAEDHPTTHLEIRQAISEAIDRPAMVELIKNGYGVPAQQHYTEDSPWHIDYEPHSNEADVDRALELIDEAGFDTPVEINIMSNSEDPVLRDIGRVTEDMLSQAGFEPELVEYETGTWSENMFDLEYDITPNYQGNLTTPDGLRIWYHGEDSVTGNWENDRATELFGLANSETDEETQIEYYAELFETVADELPNCFLYHPEWIHAHRTEVEGYEAHTDMTVMNLEDVQLQ